MSPGYTFLGNLVEIEFVRRNCIVCNRRMNKKLNNLEGLKKPPRLDPPIISFYLYFFFSSSLHGRDIIGF